MGNVEAIIITIVAFILAAVVCMPLSETDALVPVFLIAWVAIGFLIAELYSRMQKK